MNLRRNRAYTLFVELDGQEPHRVLLDPQRDPAATWQLVGNVFLFQILGFVIDMHVRAHLHLVPYPRDLVTVIELDSVGNRKPES